MILWTYHQPDFDLNTVEKVDPALGCWWRHKKLGARYRELLPLLIKCVDCEHFLWCCTERGWLAEPGEKIVEWQLDVPDCAVAGMVDAVEWDKLLRGKTDDLSGLLLPTRERRAGKEIDALVRVPLPPGSAAKIGLVPDVDQWNSRRR